MNKIFLNILFFLFLSPDVFLQETGSLCGFLLRGIENDSLAIKNAELYVDSEIWEPKIINPNYFIYHNLPQQVLHLRIKFEDGRCLNKKISVKKDSLTSLCLFSRTIINIDNNSFQYTNVIYDTINIDTLYVKDFYTFGSIEGTVGNPNPIKGAFVNVINLASTETDSNGSFYFPYIPPGDYDVRAGSEPYYTSTITSVKVQPSKSSVVNFLLSVFDFNRELPWNQRYKQLKNKRE